MGEFVCRVADANGRVYSHVEAAGTQAEARQKLADRGLYVYSVENRSSLLSGMLQRQSSRKIGGSDFLILNQQFNTLIKAGLPILRALTEADWSKEGRHTESGPYNVCDWLKSYASHLTGHVRQIERNLAAFAATRKG